MRRGSKVEQIILTMEENNRLVEWTPRHKTSQAIALRARIVLACRARSLQPRDCVAVARERIERGQVAWALSGATSGRSLDEPRPGAPRTISDEKVERVITKHPVPIICNLHPRDPMSKEGPFPIWVFRLCYSALWSPMVACQDLTNLRTLCPLG